MRSSQTDVWHILHIDDDEDDHIIVKAMLSEARGQTIRVDWAPTIEEGRQKLLERPYQAALIDYDLGLLTGIDLIREFVERGCSIPMILLTGRGSYEVDVEAMHAGATLYLTKNEINPLLLERSIRYAIERKQTESTLRESEARLRLSEEKLRESERSATENAERFRTILENSLDVAYRRNLQTDRYDYMSPVVEQVLGFTVDEMINMKFEEALERIHPDDREGVNAEISRAVESGKGKLEYRFRCKNGSFRWLADYITVTKDAVGNLLYRTGIVRDVTEQVLSERALRASEERFQLASRAVNGVLYDWSIDRNELYQSEGLVRVVGYRPGEEPGGSRDWWPRNIHPEDYGRIQVELQNAVDGRTDSISYEYRIRHRDGHWVHILDQGYIVRDENNQARRVVGICTDISDRVRSEQVLRESENKHRQLAEALEVERAKLAAAIDHLPVGVGMGDSQGNTLSLNSAGLALHGFQSEAEMFSRLENYVKDFELRYLDGRVMPVEEWPVSRAMRGEFVQNYEVRLVNKIKNNEHVLSYSVAPVFNKVGEAVLIVYVIQDLTDQRRSLEDVERSRKQLEAVLNSLAEGVVILDDQGTVLDMNQAALELLGYTTFEDSKRLNEYGDLFEILSLEGLPLPVENWPISRLLHGETFTGLEARVRRKDSGVEWIGSFNGKPVRDSSGEPMLGVFTMRDITQQKMAEALSVERNRALRESEARYRQLADAMPQVVWTAEPDGTVDYYNQRLLQYREGAEPPVGIWELILAIHPDDAQPTQDAWETAISTESTYQTEHRLKMADGSYRWHLSRGVPAFDEHGRLVKWYGTSTDIHELKRAQAELAEYTEKLKRSNEELENFAFVASHDLQEPLRKIRMFSESTRRHLSGQLSPDVEDYLDRMQSAAERMQLMIDGLLDLSRVSTRGKDFSLVDLADVVAEVVSDLEARIQASKGQVVVEPLPSVDGDALQLRRLMQNLIGNALKFHKDGEAPVVRVSGKLLKDDQEAVAQVVVEDNGIGFDETDMDRIFHPFVRLHGRSDFEGSGIGLAICRKIVERHGGKISAKSHPGMGSQFIITLPVREHS